jgi:hypothetical protein
VGECQLWEIFSNLNFEFHYEYFINFKTCNSQYLIEIMGAHLGKNSSEDGDLQKNIPSSFQNVDWSAVDLLWKMFLKGDSPDFVMDKNELETLFEAWQKDGKEKQSEDSWFHKVNIDSKDLYKCMSHFTYNIEDTRSGDDEDDSEQSDGEQKESKMMWSREYVDVMEIIFTVLILSKGTTQQKLKLMYRCANFDDESEAMSKDDILLPLKAFVTSAFTIFNLVLVDDENIESMCEQLYYDVCCVDLKKAAVGAFGNNTPRKSKAETKSGKEKSVLNSFTVDRLLAWATTEPVIESWLSPKKLSSNRGGTKEEDSKDGDVDPEILHEIEGIPKRTSEITLAMDPDHLSNEGK